jgi:hypothetical protein
VHNTYGCGVGVDDGDDDDGYIGDDDGDHNDGDNDDDDDNENDSDDHDYDNDDEDDDERNCYENDLFYKFNFGLGIASDERLCEVILSATYLDVQLVHLYSEGIEMTIADLCLFTYLYFLLVRLHPHILLLAFIAMTVTGYEKINVVLLLKVQVRFFS